MRLPLSSSTKHHLLLRFSEVNSSRDINQLEVDHVVVDVPPQLSQLILVRDASPLELVELNLLIALEDLSEFLLHIVLAMAE